MDTQEFLKLAARQDQLLVRAHINNRVPVEAELEIEVWFELPDVPPSLVGMTYKARLSRRITDGLVSLFPSTTSGRIALRAEVAKAVLKKWENNHPRWLQNKPAVVTYQDQRCFEEQGITGWLLFAHLLQMRAAVDLRGTYAPHFQDDRRIYHQLGGRLTGLINEAFRQRFDALRSVEA